MKTARSVRWCSWLAALLVLCPAIAEAHMMGTPGGGLRDGLTHPLTGLDHVCAMLGVGLLAAQRGGRSLWAIPLAFLATMACGGALAMCGVSMPWVEPGIVASVLILGVLLAAAIPLPLAASVALVSLFALFHGHAHGDEIPAAASGLLYSLGFLASSLLLIAAGAALRLVAGQTATLPVTRLAGATLVLCGIYLATAG